jgi:polyhydroxybutyrate depolymerase
MSLKKYSVIALLAIMAMVLSIGSPITLAEYIPESSPGLHTGWMMETYNGYNGTWSCNRTYLYYIPSSYDGSEAVPLLFSFHGMGSSGVEQIDLTKFDELAEQEGFIAVFPDSTNLPRDEESPCYPSLIALENANPVFASIDLIQWNIGTNLSLQYCAGVDDVGFASDMVDWFDDNYNIDESHIYATGMSNGAQFSHYVALMLPDTFAGIAPVCSPLTTNTTWESVTPTTVIMMMGPTDPIVPYDGNALASIYSMNDTVDFWLDVDGIPLETEPVETVWGPTSKDFTVVHRYVYSGGTNGTEVILFKVDGGGHTWPGGPQYSSVVVIGFTTTHIDGSALIWKHLQPEKYYLAIYNTLGGSVTTPDQETFSNVKSAGEYMFFYPGTGNTVVDLEAVPDDSSYEFVNWTGDVDTIEDVNDATTTITITPDKDYEITANFQLKEEEEQEQEPPAGFCFIATAAYGTPTAKQLGVQREFRDEVLLKSTVGSRLVDFYYRTSPPIANFISQHGIVRTLVRELLIDPIVCVVEATGNIWRN